MSTPTASRAAFRRLHESGCFVLPNPWDIGTARHCKHLGFKALGTTSAGVGFTRGMEAAEWLPLDMALAHTAEIVEATDLPVTADFQAGYADDLKGLAENVR